MSTFLENFQKKLEKGVETDQNLFLIVFTLEESKPFNTYLLAKSKLEATCKLLFKFDNAVIYNVIDLGIPTYNFYNLINSFSKD